MSLGMWLNFTVKTDRGKMNKQKPLELLVVEDTPRHLADAKQFFGDLQQRGIVNATYAGTLAEAEQALATRSYDGVISDIFFPMGFAEAEATKARMNELIDIMDDVFRKQEEGLERERKRDPSDMSGNQYRGRRALNNQHDAMGRWAYGKDQPPSGMLVAKKAIEKGMPVVFCTDTYHHDHATEPINLWKYDFPIRMVDTAPGSNNPKPWREAYAEIIAPIILEREKEKLAELRATLGPKSYTRYQIKDALIRPLEEISEAVFKPFMQDMRTRYGF